MIRVSFQPMCAGEIKTLTFPFTSQMTVGETISTQSVAASVWSGTDASPADVVSGSASASGQNVTQKITAVAAVLGVVYDLVCTITTSAGQTLQCGGYLAVIPNTP